MISPTPGSGAISENLMYCEFVDSDNFIEAYDLKADPAQLINIKSTMDPQKLSELNEMVSY